MYVRDKKVLNVSAMDALLNDYFEEKQENPQCK